MALWLALHSRPVFRDGFLLAYVVLKFMLGWVRNILEFEKRIPNWGEPRNLDKECAHPNRFVNTKFLV